MHGERGGVCGKRGACMVKGGHAWYAPPPIPTRYGRSLRGRYASYWNAFLFKLLLLAVTKDSTNSQMIICLVTSKTRDKSLIVDNVF